MWSSPERTRDVLLVTLAVTTGATDATAFERLGSVFASVITGNLILLGISAVRAEAKLALFTGCALVGYSLGVVAAAPRPRREQTQAGVWPVGATAALTLDFALLAAFAVGWELTSDRPGRPAQALLLGLAAAAMGVQSTAVRRLGQLSTTYLTSTLTGLVEAITIRRWPQGSTRSLGIIVMALVGAGAGTALIEQARDWLPGLQLAPLGIVIVASLRVIKPTPRPAP